MSVKKIRYTITSCDCRYRETGTTRGRWYAEIKVLGYNPDGTAAGTGLGEGEGSAAYIAMRDAISGAFADLGRKRRAGR